MIKEQHQRETKHPQANEAPLTPVAGRGRRYLSTSLHCRHLTPSKVHTVPPQEERRRFLISGFPEITRQPPPRGLLPNLILQAYSCVITCGNVNSVGLRANPLQGRCFATALAVASLGRAAVHSKTSSGHDGRRSLPVPYGSAGPEVGHQLPEPPRAGTLRQ